MKAWGIYIPADVDRPTERPACWMRTSTFGAGVDWAMIFRTRVDAAWALEEQRQRFAGCLDTAEVREFDWALTP